MNDWLNARIFHPLARVLAKGLRPTGVSPNMVSVAGGLLVAAAALFYTGLGAPQSIPLGFAAHLLWHVIDGADGELARLNGTASPAGELIDGICDYAGHVFLYTLLAVYAYDSIGHWTWFLALAAGVSRVLQSNHSESQRRTYLWRVYGIPWLRHAQAGNDELFKRSGLARIFTDLARGYIALAELVSPSSVEVDAIVDGAEEIGLRTRVRRLCRRGSRTSLRLQTWLGANPRTLILGLSMAAGSPLWFFLVELVPLNLLLIWSVIHQKRCNTRLGEGLERLVHSSNAVRVKTSALR